MTPFNLFRRKRLSAKCKTALLATMEVQLSAGGDVVGVIRNFVERARLRKHYVADQPLLWELVSNLRGGATISSALRRHLSGTEFALFRAGETAGKLEQACAQAQELGERQRRIQLTIRGAATGPVVYLLSLFFTLYIVASQVVPALAGVLPPKKWTGLAAFVYETSLLASPLGLGLSLGVLALLIFTARYYFPRGTGRTRVLLERYIPLLSMYRDMQGALWVGSFAALLEAGLPDTRILELQAKDGSPWLTERLNRLLGLLRNGFGLGDALMFAGPAALETSRPELGLKFDFPSPEIIDTLASFAGSPEFSTRLLLLRRRWLNDIEQHLKSRINLIGVVIQVAVFIYLILFTLGVNQLQQALPAAA